MAGRGPSRATQVPSNSFLQAIVATTYSAIPVKFYNMLHYQFSGTVLPTGTFQ